MAPSESHCDARQQQDVDACNGNMQKTSEVMIADKSSECKNDNDNSVFDVGLYIQATARINDDLKYHILTEPFKPHETYDFKKMCQNMKLESDGLDMHGWFNMLLGWRTL